MLAAAYDLTCLLRALPAGRMLGVRHRDTGLGVMFLTPHESEILCECGHVEGVVTRRGAIKYLRLTVEPRVAQRDLHRRLCSLGRTVAEASQLVSRRNIAGAGVVYSHNMRRVAAYEPSMRRGSHPVYAVLHAAEVS